MFTRACEQELDYQELATDISLGCFCRTGVLNSCGKLSSILCCLILHCVYAYFHLLPLTPPVSSSSDYSTSQCCYSADSTSVYFDGNLLWLIVIYLRFYRHMVSSLTIITPIIVWTVILETDAECDTARVLLQNMTFTPEDAVNVAQYIKRLPVKTCGTKAKASLKKMIEAKFVWVEADIYMSVCVSNRMT